MFAKDLLPRFESSFPNQRHHRLFLIRSRCSLQVFFKKTGKTGHTIKPNMKAGVLHGMTRS